MAATQTKIKYAFKVDGVLTDATTVKLSDPTGTFGVKRKDTGATVVADGTSLTRTSLGVYEHTFTDPASGLTYEFWLEIVYGGKTRHIEYTKSGGIFDNLYDLLPEVQKEIEGDINESVIKRALRRAARLFLLQTELWRETLSATTTATDEYTLSGLHTHSAHIKRVDNVKVADDPIKFEKVSTDGTVVTLSNKTLADKTIEFEVVFIPNESNTDLPAWIVERWDRALVLGTLYELKKQNRRPWSDPNGAQLAYRELLEEVGRAKHEKYSARGPVGNLRIQPRAFV